MRESFLENGKFVGDWLDIKVLGTEKIVSLYVVFQSQVACGIPSPHSLWSRNASRTCYTKRGVLRAASLPVEVG